MRTFDTKEFKKAMIDADMDSFVELEASTKINRNTLSSYAKGEQKPSYDSIAALADALHLTYEELGRIFFYNELAQEQK